MKILLAFPVLVVSALASAKTVCGINNNRGREITTQVCVDRGADGKIVMQLQTQNGPVSLKEVKVVKQHEGYENSLFVSYVMAPVDGAGQINGRARFGIDIGFASNGVAFTANNMNDRNKSIGSFVVGLK